MKFSLIVTTRGRTEELLTLFRSLRGQTLQDFEVIVADQNEDDRVTDLLRREEPGFPLTRVASRGGASRGRNDGLARAQGELIGFPDDDCAFPPGVLAQVADFFVHHPEYGFISGRSVDDAGNDSVSRHAPRASEIARRTIHSQCIEFGIFVRRATLGAMRFDEAMGVGAATPWHSDEGPDLLLRLMARGERGYYDPHLEIWHPRPVTRYDARDIDRTYRYACGTGYFYRKHGFPFHFFARQMARTGCGVLLALATFHPGKARLYAARLRGRWKGWRAAQANEVPAPPALEAGELRR